MANLYQSFVAVQYVLRYGWDKTIFGWREHGGMTGNFVIKDEFVSFNAIVDSKLITLRIGKERFYQMEVSHLFKLMEDKINKIQEER